MLRAKMRVTEVTRSIDEKGNVSCEQVKLMAVYGTGDSENAHWSKWTPSAHFSITISNPDAYGKLTNGHEFYVDFTPVQDKA